jgi:ATP-dependent DNA helicase PIF1
VRRAAIARWLDFLRQNHPGYRAITVSSDNMNALPARDDVTSQTVEPVEVDAADQPYDDPVDDPDYVGVPNLVTGQDEVAVLRDMVMPHRPAPEMDWEPSVAAERRRHITLPSIRQTPISEFDRSQPLLSLACPSLFPKGAAEFVQARPRSID